MIIGYAISRVVGCLTLTALALSLIFASTRAVADERDAWAALVNGSHVALVRYGSAPPGFGDPPGFKIDDCATQRNMDERGRAQARADHRGSPPDTDAHSVTAS